MVTPNLAGPPTLSPAGVIAPITTPSYGITFSGPTNNTAPPINPTNPVSNSFQVNPTGSSGLRNPSNDYRP
jgi:hypothetical protein